MLLLQLQLMSQQAANELEQSLRTTECTIEIIFSAVFSLLSLLTNDLYLMPFFLYQS